MRASNPFPSTHFVRSGWAPTQCYFAGMAARFEEWGLGAPLQRGALNPEAGALRKFEQNSLLAEGRKII